jgi:hypothetical protein
MKRDNYYSLELKSERVVELKSYHYEQLCT